VAVVSNYKVLHEMTPVLALIDARLYGGRKTDHEEQAQSHSERSEGHVAHGVGMKVQ
jgi:hypothetical protein